MTPQQAYQTAAKLHRLASICRWAGVSPCDIPDSKWFGCGAVTIKYGRKMWPYNGSDKDVANRIVQD